jgi:hypothetical protein
VPPSGSSGYFLVSGETMCGWISMMDDMAGLLFV